MSSDDGDAGGDAGSPIPGMGVVRAVTPDFVRARFALKFLIVLLVMGLVIGAIGAVATAQISTQTQDRIESEYNGLAQQESNLLQQWIQRNQLTTRLTSGQERWAAEQTAGMGTSLSTTRQNELPLDAANVHIFNQTESGQYVVASTTMDASTALSETNRSWVTGVELEFDQQVYMSDVYLADGIPVVGYLTPVDGTDNRVMLIEYRTDTIASQFQGSERAEGGFTQVVGSDGTVFIDGRDVSSAVKSQEALSRYGDDAAMRPVRQAMELDSGGSGVIAKMDADPQVIDEEYSVGYAAVTLPDDRRWVVLVHAPTSELFGFVQTISDFGLLATGGGVALMLLLGAVLGFNTSTAIDRLTKKAEAMEDGNLDVDIESDRIDSIGQLYDGFAEMRDALKQQIDEAEAARKEAEVSRAEAMEMNNYLQEKAEEYSATMQACARGDLTRRMEADGENDAMDQIADDFNEMISELEMTTGQLKTFAVEVEEGGRGVQQSAETVRDASEQVADSVQKISDDAYDQKERLQTISEDMDAIADQLETFAAENESVDFGDSLDAIQEIASMIDEAADLGEQTMAESENVAGAAEEQAAELNEVSSRAEELVRYAQYLGDGLNNFETEEEHEFVFQTGAGGPGAGAEEE